MTVPRGGVIVGASSCLFACDPETLRLQQSLLGSHGGGGFVDDWENQPTVDGKLSPTPDMCSSVGASTTTTCGPTPLTRGCRLPKFGGSPRALGSDSLMVQPRARSHPAPDPAITQPDSPHE